MSYLAYENQIYWGRANFFLLGNIALLGFLGSTLRLNEDVAFKTTRFILPFVSAFGVVLVGLWYEALEAGESWISHWHEILKNLEQEAYGDRTLIRDHEPPGGKPNKAAKSIAKHTMMLFFAVWCLLFVLSLLSWPPT